jgi:hypothetical protein
VTSVATTFNGTQTDNQAFCYDELNRLAWASSQSGTGPNGCASNSAGTLGAARSTPRASATTRREGPMVKLLKS